jgi:hypothetical protein
MRVSIGNFDNEKSSERDGTDGTDGTDRTNNHVGRHTHILAAADGARESKATEKGDGQFLDCPLGRDWHKPGA